MEFDSITSLIEYCSNKNNETINISHPIRIEILTVLNDDDNIVSIDNYSLLYDDDIKHKDYGTAFENHILPKLKKFEKIVNDNNLRFKLNSEEIKNINELFELYINKQEYEDPYLIKQNSKKLELTDHSDLGGKADLDLKNLEDVLESDDIPNEELYCYPPENVNILDYYFNAPINIFTSDIIHHYISKIYLYNCTNHNLRKELCLLYNNNTNDSIYMPSYFSKAKFKQSKLYNTKMGTIVRNEFFKSINAPRDLAFKQFFLLHTTTEEIEKNEELRKIKDELDKYKLKSEQDKNENENEDFEDFEDFEDELDEFEAENEFKMYKCYLKRYITGNKAILKNGCEIEIDNSKFNNKSIIYQYPQLIDYDFEDSQIMHYYLTILFEIINDIDFSCQNKDENEDENEMLKQFQNNKFEKILNLLINIENDFNSNFNININNNNEDIDLSTIDNAAKFKNIKDNILLIIERK